MPHVPPAAANPISSTSHGLAQLRRRFDPLARLALRLPTRLPAPPSPIHFTKEEREKLSTLSCSDAPAKVLSRKINRELKKRANPYPSSVHCFRAVWASPNRPKSRPTNRPRCYYRVRLLLLRSVTGTTGSNCSWLLGVSVPPATGKEETKNNKKLESKVFKC